MGITFDYFTNIISITSPQTTVTMQELADAISDEEATPWGMSYPADGVEGISEIAGKFDKGGSVYSEIIVNLYTPWQVQFWGGSGVTKTTGGSLLGGLGGIPVKATGTAGDLTLVSQPVDGVLVASGTSGLTSEESTQLSSLSYLKKSVYVDTEALTNGDGSQNSPFNVLADCIDYAEAHNIDNLYVLADITLDRDLKNFTITGIGIPTVDCNGRDLNKSEFVHCRLEGSYTGEITVQECVLLSGLNLNGFFENCGLTGNLIIPANGFAFVKDCTCLLPGGLHVDLDMNTGNKSTLQVQNYNGCLTVINCDHADDSVSVGMNTGHLIFDSTCVLGTMVATGTCDFDNDSNGATVIDRTTNPRTIGDEVFNQNKYRRIMEKEGDVWYLKIYDGAELKLKKALKDKDIADITDLPAGVVAIEEASSV